MPHSNRDALEAANVDNVQYIQAEIEARVSGKVHTNCAVGNVLGVVDCIDMERSEVTMRAAFPTRFERLTSCTSTRHERTACHCCTEVDLDLRP